MIESAIWIIAVSKVIQNVADPILIGGYAAGFAAGTILGSYLENIIGVGSMVVKVFIPNESNNLANILRDNGYAVTVINGEGRDGAVKIYWCIVARKKLNKVLKIINKNNPQAYITTEAVNPISISK
ncbi:MAG: hypothetical protein CMC32_03005 [Flavobacteriaceae bacterium]|nr:hypothetical protein [Flavobacteriaceae bacterium]